MSYVIEGSNDSTVIYLRKIMRTQLVIIDQGEDRVVVTDSQIDEMIKTLQTLKEKK